MSEMLDMLFSMSQDNLAGGHDFLANDGSLVGHSQENILGGHDVYGEDGSLVARTQPNVFDGENIMDAQGASIGHTAEGITGTDIHGASGEYQGTVHDTATGTAFSDLQGEQMAWRQNLVGGVSADPMTQVNALRFPSLL